MNDDRDRWVASWWPRVYRMALAMTAHEADAEDLAQETMISALGARGRFRGGSAESTWLYAILRHKLADRARRRRVAVEPAPPARSAACEAADLLGGLPETLRLTAALFYIDDLSVEEISAALDVPAATVRWRLFEARRQLKARLCRETP